MSWHTCVLDPDYEICDEYPYPIRRIGSDRVISESIDAWGYVICSMNRKLYKKHRIVALQFIDNDDPDNKTEVDHINHDRSDYHIENLRWATPSTNHRNKSSHRGVEYAYYDQIPEDSILVNDYGNHQFDFYYYSESVDAFFFYTGQQYKQLHVNEDKRDGGLFVYMINTNGKNVQVRINKFKKLYGIDY